MSNTFFYEFSFYKVGLSGLINKVFELFSPQFNGNVIVSIFIYSIILVFMHVLDSC